MKLEGLKMPKLGFGMMRLPEQDGEVDISRVCEMVDRYMDSGMNYFDTAYMYHNGKSEEVVKKTVVDRYPRDSYYLTTKLPQWMMKGKEDRDRILEDQLAKTGAGYFDIYLLHSVEDGEKYEGYLEYDCFQWAMEKKAEGKFRHFGFSYHGTAELLDEILAVHPEVEVVQIQLNYADWDNPLIQSGKIYDVLCKYDIPILVMEPVKGGTLAQMDPKVEKIFKEASPDATIASWALRFAGSLPGVVTVLSGMSSEEQMEDNLNTFTHFQPLSEKEQETIHQVVEAMAENPGIACTACRYCVEGCPQKIHIPDVLKALSTLRVYGEAWRSQNFYQSLLKQGSGSASGCVACGGCEGVCPQHLPIIELMKEAAEKLETAE